MALLTRTGLCVNRYCSTADLPFFKMATVRHLEFLKVGSFYFLSASEAKYASSVPNLAKIGQTVQEILPIFDFSRWRPSAILDWFYACWDHLRRVFGGLCDCAKFGGNRCSNFDSMQILIFCTLSLKMPIHAPKIWVFGDFTPTMGSSMYGTPKRHILRRKYVV